MTVVNGRPYSRSTGAQSTTLVTVLQKICMEFVFILKTSCLNAQYFLFFLLESPLVSTYLPTRPVSKLTSSSPPLTSVGPFFPPKTS